MWAPFRSTGSFSDSDADAGTVVKSFGGEGGVVAEDRKCKATRMMLASAAAPIKKIQRPRFFMTCSEIILFSEITTATANQTMALPQHPS
jgi:hypothetical protein